MDGYVFLVQFTCICHSLYWTINILIINWKQTNKQKNIWIHKWQNTKKFLLVVVVIFLNIDLLEGKERGKGRIFKSHPPSPTENDESQLYKNRLTYLVGVPVQYSFSFRNNENRIRKCTYKAEIDHFYNINNIIQ